MRRRAVMPLDGWVGALVLFTVALAAFWIEALAWPLQRGRDSWDYWLYYLQLLDHHPPFSYVMVFRTPVTPLVTGLPMHIGGAQLLEVVAAAIYAAAVVGWAWAARPFGRTAALLTAVALLVFQLPYATLFHQVSSDFVFGALLALWAGFVVRAALRPAWSVLVGLGVTTAALTLTRPAGQVLLISAVAVAVVAAGSARARLTRLGIVAAAALVPLLLWSGVNAVRYDDFTVARGGKAWVPFFKVFGHGKIDRGNGPASQRLAAAVERNVLTLPDFRRLDVDVQTYFRGASNFETIRVIALSDREFGRSSDYDVLFDSALEAVRHNKEWYLRDVSRTLWDFVSQRFALEPVRRETAAASQPDQLVVDGKPMPSPAALSPLVQAARFGFVWCPTDELDRCVFRDPAVAFPRRRDQRRYRELVNRVRDWNAQLPVRDGRSWLAGKLNTLSWNTPRPVFWLLFGLLVLLVRRPRAWPALLILLVSAGLVLFVHALSQDPQPEFELPLSPLFVLAGIAALFAPRRGSATVSSL